MKKVIITGMLAVCSLILTVVIGIGTLSEDRNAPVINLEGKNNLTYTQGEDYEILLENMSAEDKEDGDVTDSLRVSNIYATGADKAIVVYVAKDEANNIAKLKREVRYRAKGDLTAVTEDSDETVEEQKPETTRVTTTQETTATVPEAGNDNSTGPKILMIQNEATLKVGETFNVLRYIQSATDRDGSNLSRSIHIDGTYDMSRAGVYSIRVYATNASGETSNVETFTLTVEP